MEPEIKVIASPVKEDDVLAVTRDDATKEAVAQHIEARAECCVDHLCGCSS
jgi:hypothetical protein